MCEALLKQYYSGQAHSLAMKNRLNESFENDRAVSRRLEKTKANIREGQLAVIPSAIRSSIRHEHYVFIVSKRCSLSKLLNNSSGLMNNTSMSGSEKMPGGNDQRIAAALCHCPLFEIRAANCSSHVLTCCCDEAPIA